jgi:uncharacterized protein YhbP (UPF0306 family)
MKFTSDQLKQATLEYIETNRLMSVATITDGKPWAVTVFFAYDKHLNLYFFSRPDTVHAVNIEKDNNVAVTINQNWGKPGKVKGIQLVGKAHKAHNPVEIALYLKRHPWGMIYPDHRVYKIEPEELYMVNHELFGHFNRVKIV